MTTPTPQNDDVLKELIALYDAVQTAEAKFRSAIEAARMGRTPITRWVEWKGNAPCPISELSKNYFIKLGTGVVEHSSGLGCESPDELDWETPGLIVGYCVNY